MREECCLIISNRYAIISRMSMEIRFPDIVVVKDINLKVFVLTEEKGSNM